MTEKLTPDEIQSERLALAVGHLIILWAQIDGVLTTVVLILHLFLGGHPSEPTAPRALDRKVRFIRKCYAEKPELVPFGTEMDAVLIRAKTSVVDRNTLAHGALVSEGPGTMSLLRLDMLEAAKLDIRDYTDQSVYALVMEAAALLSDIVTAAHRLTALIPEDAVGESGSELAQEFIRRFPPVDLSDEESD